LGGENKAPCAAVTRESSVKNAGRFEAGSTEKIVVHWEPDLKYCGPKFSSSGQPPSDWWFGAEK
jgi:hypothetical protein